VLRTRTQPCAGFELRKKAMMEACGTGKGGTRLSFYWREREVSEVFEAVVHGATIILEQGRS